MSWRVSYIVIVLASACLWIGLWYLAGALIYWLSGGR